MKTLLINFFGGPGVGKSTAASWMFYKLKELGKEAEFVPEYAKGKVWENGAVAFSQTDEYYINAKQAHYLSRVFKKVGFVVTDAPLRGGIPFVDRPGLQQAIREEADLYKDCEINFFIARQHKYKTNGRIETEDYASVLDNKILKELNSTDVEYTVIEPTAKGYKMALKKALEKMETL